MEENSQKPKEQHKKFCPIMSRDSKKAIILCNENCAFSVYLASPPNPPERACAIATIPISIFHLLAVVQSIGRNQLTQVVQQPNVKNILGIH